MRYEIVLSLLYIQRGGVCLSGASLEGKRVNQTVHITDEISALNDLPPSSDYLQKIGH